MLTESDPNPRRARPSGGARVIDGLVLGGILGGLAIAVWAMVRSRDAALLIETFGSRAWPRVVTALSVLLLMGAFVAWVRRARRRTASAGDLRRLFVAGVLAAAVEVAFFQPFHMTLFLVAFAWGFGLFAAVYLLPRSAVERCPARFRRGADLVLFNVCLLAVLGEFGLRGLARVSPSPLLARPSGSPAETIAHFRYPSGHVRFGFACDERGYYDVAPAEGERKKPLVCTIGDSFSTGIVPHFFHYTTVAERELGVDLYNMGTPCLSPPEYLHLLETEAVPLAPDAIVVALFIGNDVYFPTRFLRSWFERDHVLLVQVPRRLKRIHDEEEATGRTAGASFGEGDALLGSAADESAVTRAFPWVADPSLEVPVFSERAYLELEVSRAVTACAAGDDVYARLFDALDRMVAACGEIPLVFFLIPDEFQVEDELWQAVVAAAGPLDRDRPQRLVTEWMRAHDVPFCDLLPRLRAVPAGEDGRRHVFHLRDSHFNARGNRVAGEALAETLRAALAEAERGGG